MKKRSINSEPLESHGTACSDPQPGRGRQTTYDVPAGVHHTRAPFLPGEQSFNVTRNCTAVLCGIGEPIVNQIEKYNFIPTTGVLPA